MCKTYTNAEINVFVFPVQLVQIFSLPDINKEKVCIKFFTMREAKVETEVCAIFISLTKRSK